MLKLNKEEKLVLNVKDIFKDVQDAEKLEELKNTIIEYINAMLQDTVTEDYVSLGKEFVSKVDDNAKLTKYFVILKKDTNGIYHFGEDTMSGMAMLSRIAKLSNDLALSKAEYMDIVSDLVKTGQTYFDFKGVPEDFLYPNDINKKNNYVNVYLTDPREAFEGFDLDKNAMSNHSPVMELRLQLAFPKPNTAVEEAPKEELPVTNSEATQEASHAPAESSQAEEQVADQAPASN